MPRPPLRAELLEARTNPAFGLDPAFGAGGVLRTAPQAGVGDEVVVQADGDILVLGAAWDHTDTANSPAARWLELRRLNPDGTPDTSFGVAGRVAFGYGRSDLFPSDLGLAVGPGGRAYVAASVGTYDAADAVVFRFNPDGTPDTTFGTGGAAAFDFPGGAASTVTGLAVLPDGRAVVTGDTSSPLTPGFSVARLTAAGTPDPTFGGDGFVRHEFDPAYAGGSTAAHEVVAGPGGEILIGGVRGRLVIPPGWVPLPPPPAGQVYYDDMRPGPHPYYEYQSVVVRLAADGSPDAAFDGDGVWVAGENGAVELSALSDLALQADGRVLVLGRPDPGTYSAAVARLNPDGSPDASFGGGGRVVAVADGTYAGTNTVAVLPDARIVVVTSAANDPVAVAVLNPDGSPAGAFPGGADQFGLAFGGDFVNQRWGTQVSAGGATVGPDGRIVVTGVHYPPGSFDYTRVRYGVAVLADLPGAVGPASPTVAPLPPPAALFGGGGVRTATADVDGDGDADTVSVTGPGTPVRVTVVSGRDGSVLAQPFDPFGGDFGGGGYVAAADFDGDGRAEFVVTPDRGGGPRVSIFSLTPTGAVATRANFLGIDDPAFRGGVRVAAGDVDRDGTADLVLTAGAGGGPRVAVLAGTGVLTTQARLVNDFFAFSGADAGALRDGAYVAAGDVDGDGFADLVFGGGPGGAPRVLALSGARVAAGDVAGARADPVASFFVGGATADRGGVRVAVTDADGDGRADVAAAGAGRGRVYRGADLTGPAEPAAFRDLGPLGDDFPGGVFVG